MKLFLQYLQACKTIRQTYFVNAKWHIVTRSNGQCRRVSEIGPTYHMASGHKILKWQIYPILFGVGDCPHGAYQNTFITDPPHIAYLYGLRGFMPSVIKHATQEVLDEWPDRTIKWLLDVDGLIHASNYLQYGHIPQRPSSAPTPMLPDRWVQVHRTDCMKRDTTWSKVFASDEEAPLSKAEKRRRAYIPTGNPRGRPRKLPKPPMVISGIS